MAFDIEKSIKYEYIFQNDVSINATEDYTLDVVLDEYAKLYPASNSYQQIALDMYLELVRRQAALLETTVMGFITNVMSEIRLRYKDIRCEERCTYSLEIIFMIILLASCRGIVKSEDIVSFYRKHYPELFLLIPGIPKQEHKLSVSTINLAMTWISPEDVNDFFTAYFAQIKHLITEQITYNGNRYMFRDEHIKDTIGFDGQELKASNRKGNSNRQCKHHVVTLHNCTQNRVMNFHTAEAKNQEAAIAIEHFFNIDLKDYVVMTDALNCKGKVSKAITKAGGLYLFRLKYNCNKDLTNHIDVVFDRNEQRSIKAQSIADRRHGRIDTYEYEILESTHLNSNFKHDFADIKTLVRVKKTSAKVIDSKIDKQSYESKIYISSIPFNDLTMEQVRASLEDYWGIEEHHSVLDKETLFDQDNQTLSNANSVAVKVGYIKMGYSFLTDMRQKESIKQGRKKPISYDATMKAINESTIADQLFLMTEFMMPG